MVLERFFSVIDAEADGKSDLFRMYIFDCHAIGSAFLFFRTEIERSAEKISSVRLSKKNIHNFVFENSKIESYVNTVTSNFVSFKITTKHLQKQFIFKNPDNYGNVLSFGETLK